jgi:diaminopimelate decarboxylase
MLPIDLVQRFGSPLYVYDLTVVRARARAFADCIRYSPFQPFYAVKANPCPAVVRAIIDQGYGIDALSPGEVALALRLGVKPDLVLYTENNMTDIEMNAAIAQGVLINCGSLDRLERLGASGAKTASVRFNPDVGASAHAKTLTAGPMSKFGIHHSEVERVREIESRTGIAVIGCHMHIGSGFLDAVAFVEAMGVILDVARKLPHLRFIDFGGGIGIPYREEEKPVDLRELGSRIDRAMESFCAAYGRPLELRLEPGRFLVAEAGTLYTTVTSVKRNPGADGRTYVGCDTGFNHLIRPCMYDAYHRIENITGGARQREVVDVVGNICESGDVFARDRKLPQSEVGDILAIRDAGAYGMAMASTYNMRPLPAEVVLDGQQARLARTRQSIEELMSGYVW